jgi:hypothetical protein
LTFAIEGVPEKSNPASYLRALTVGIESPTSAKAINRDPFGGARDENDCRVNVLDLESSLRLAKAVGDLKRRRD